MTTRRVVTGIDNEGKSYFLHDGPTPGNFDIGVITSDEIWIDDPGNPDPAGSVDPAVADTFHLEPPDGGSVLRITTFVPGVDEAAVIAAVQTGTRFDTGDALERDDPGMHTTATIDYGIVLSGEIDLELDGGEVHLGPGDVVVQRGTRHAWRLRSDEPCTMAFVLIASSNYR